MTRRVIRRPRLQPCWRRPAIAGACAALLLAACSRGEATRTTAPAAEEARRAATTAVAHDVAVARPSRERLQTSFEAPGTATAFDEATISAEAAGPVRQITFDDGSRVARGQMLVRLDDSKAKLALAQAEASLAQAQANFEKARGELERKKQLLDDRTIAPGTFETFKAQHDAAAAGVDAARTAVDLARRRLQDLVVMAPFAGVVKQRMVTPGEYVREGDKLLVLMRVDPIKLRFDLPEKYAGRVAAGQTVRATFAADPGAVFEAKVRTVFPAVDVQSRTLRVEAEMRNPAHRVKPGFYASVRLGLASLPGSFVVPRAAVVPREGTENVFVVSGDRVSLVPVQTGAESADLVEIVSGLSGTEQIVVAGADTLRPGDRVKVRG